MLAAPNYPVPEEFNEHTAVAVTNTGPKPFIGGHAGKKHQINPGETRYLPWDAVCRWVGNPFARNMGADRQLHFRTNEVDRLSTVYGTYSEPWSTDEPYEIVDTTGPAGMKPIVYEERPDGRFYHPHIPSLLVKSSDGQVLTTVLQDPEGADVTPAEQTSITESRTLAAAVAELQRQLAQTQLQLAQSQGGQFQSDNTEFAEDAVTDTAAVTPEAKTPSRPTVGDPRSTRGPGRPRKDS